MNGYHYREKVTKQLSRIGLLAPSKQTTEENKEVKEDSQPVEIPPVDHHVYGVYWLNDNSVAVVMSERYDENKSRILALNIHGGFDWISIPYRADDCVFQQVSYGVLFDLQEVDGLRIITKSELFLLRQNMSRALYIPSHYSIRKEFAYYPDYFISIYNEYIAGNEDIVRKYQAIPEDSKELIIEELLKVSISKRIHVQYCEWNNYNEQNTLLLSSLKLAIRHLPSQTAVRKLCNKLYFTCCNIKVLYNLRFV